MGVTHEKTNHAIGNSADDFRLVQLLCTGHVAAIMLAVQDFAAAASYTVIPVLTFNSVCPLTAILITTSIPTIFHHAFGNVLRTTGGIPDPPLLANMKCINS